jgi:hypothetical protein
MSGALGVNTFCAALVEPGTLRQVALANIDRQPSLMLVHLCVDEITWLIGYQLWMSPMNLVDVHLSRCASPSAGGVVGHVLLPRYAIYAASAGSFRIVEKLALAGGDGLIFVNVTDHSLTCCELLFRYRGALVCGNDLDQCNWLWRG